MNNATEIRLLAERQMGEFLKAMPAAQGKRTDLVPEWNQVTAPTLADIGITKKQSHVAQNLANILEPEFRERIAVAKCDGGRLSTAKVLAPASYVPPTPSGLSQVKPANAGSLSQISGAEKCASLEKRKAPGMLRGFSVQPILKILTSA